jgi:enoyl-CoA hydratase/carnithine racemase
MPCSRLLQGAEEIYVDYQTIRYEVAEQILTITLNRPEQLNAFTPRMADELIDAFDRASVDEAVRAIIVTGAGRAFCAGMDLSVAGNVFGLDETLQPTLEDMTQRLDDPQVVAGVRDTGGRVALRIFACPKPVIAAINGAAVGIGATMTLPMDIRIASDKARIGFVFGKIGIVPEACSSWFLPRIVGISQALEWVYTADTMDGEEARRGGLVRAVVAAADLLAEARALAKRIVENRSPVAIALARQMLYRNAAQPHPLAAHRIDSLGVFYTSRKDGREGVQAFLEKRAPQFTSRVPHDLPPFYEEWIAETDPP